MTQVNNIELLHWLDHTLEAHKFKDYCPNGLQVEGKTDIRRIVTGVTASLALLQAAVKHNADAVIVHHGWFWKNENPCIRGPKKARIALTLQHELNLYGYHLPLDAHPTLGNNVQLAQQLDLEPERDAQGQVMGCGPDGLVWLGRPKAAMTRQAMSQLISSRLGREPLLVGNADAPVQRVAWCTGGAQGFMEAAIAAGADLYITGEASEQNYHLALENNVGFIAAGHHATERYGVLALGQAIAKQFGVEVEFIDVDNPI